MKGSDIKTELRDLIEKENDTAVLEAIKTHTGYEVSEMNETQLRETAKELGIEVDVMAWTLKRRWTEAGAIGWPMLPLDARKTRPNFCASPGG